MWWFHLINMTIASTAHNFIKCVVEICSTLCCVWCVIDVINDSISCQYINDQATARTYTLCEHLPWRNHTVPWRTSFVGCTKRDHYCWLTNYNCSLYVSYEYRMKHSVRGICDIYKGAQGSSIPRSVYEHVHCCCSICLLWTRTYPASMCCMVAPMHFTPLFPRWSLQCWH